MDPEDLEPMPWRIESSLLYHAARSGFIVAGVLILAVGIGDMLAGRSRIQDYRAIIREMPPPEPHDPTALFPKASEAQVRQALSTVLCRCFTHTRMLRAIARYQKEVA